jgi:hypothetical protein
MGKQQDFEITGFAAVVDVLPIWRENSKKKFYQKKHTCVSLQGKQAVLVTWVSSRPSVLKRMVHVMFKMVLIEWVFVIIPVWLKDLDGP